MLKFARDRRRYLHWLFEAKKRYSLCVLNYMVTSNHVHLLVEGGRDREAIPRAMKLMAGRTGQEYNMRKNRQGAFWQGRYHATAVESGEHLGRCMTYIDLNMVRAGAVENPIEWKWSGYKEIQDCPQRYRRIDRGRTAELLGLGGTEELGKWQRRAVAEMSSIGPERDPMWSKNIGIGSEIFVRQLHKNLGISSFRRKVSAVGNSFVLRDDLADYQTTPGKCSTPHGWHNVNNTIKLDI